MGNTTTLYRFGPFELDERRFELRRDGQAIELQRKVLETILFLVKNRDRLVTKDDLIAGPWNGLVVSDAALSQTIMSARRALADGTGRSTQIVTVRGKGFRFKPEVSVLDGSQPPAEGSRDSIEPVPSTLRSGPPARPFVGRTRELAQLREAERAARTGRGSVQLIYGSPGIGKTTLVEHFAADCRARDVRVVWGRCWEGGGAPSFWPWAEVIRGCLRRVSFGDGKSRRSVLPDLARLVPELGDAKGAAEPADDDAEVRFRVLESVMRFLIEAAERTALVVAIEDLHAADDAALLVLDFLCRSIGHSSLLVVGTCRSLESEDRPTLRSALSGALPHVERLPLSALSEDEVRTLLQSFWSAELSDNAVASVHRATHGHPFLMQELIRSFPAGFGPDELGGLSARSVLVPERIAGSIRERLGRLPPRSRELLEAAAVVGREFHLGLLPTARDADGAEDLAARLEPALGEGLIEAAGTLSFRFAHELVRETLYGDLPPTRRFALHAAIAEVSAARLPAQPDQIFRVAHHVLAAAPGHFGAHAVEYVTRAAAHAFAQCAYELSEELYRGALELCDLGPDVPSRRAELLLARGRAQHFAGRAEAAGGTYQAALEWSRTHGLGEAFARAVLGWYEVLNVRAAVHVGFHAELTHALELHAEPSARRAQLLGALAAASYFERPLAFRRETLETAFAMARTSGDVAAFTGVADALNQCHVHLTDAEGTLALAEEMQAAATKTAQPKRGLDALELRVYSLLELGRGKEFVETLEEHARLARALRYPHHLWTADRLQAIRLFLEGNLEASEAVSRRALAFGRTHVGPIAHASFGVERLTAGLERHGPGRAQALAEARGIGVELLAMAPRYHPWIIGVGVLDLELGQPDAARRTLAKYVGDGLDEIEDDRNRLPCLGMLAVLAAAAGDDAARRAVIAAITPLRGLHVTTTSAYLGPTSLVLGRLWLAAGEPKRAVPELESAIDDSQKMGALIARARAEHLCARALGPRNARARTLLESARETARKLGLPRLEAEIAGSAG